MKEDPPNYFTQILTHEAIKAVCKTDDEIEYVFVWISPSLVNFVVTNINSTKGGGISVNICLKCLVTTWLQGYAINYEILRWGEYK